MDETEDCVEIDDKDPEEAIVIPGQRRLIVNYRILFRASTYRPVHIGVCVPRRRRGAEDSGGGPRTTPG